MNFSALLASLLPLALQAVPSLIQHAGSMLSFVIQVFPGFISGASEVTAPPVTIHENGHVYTSDPIVFHKVS